jgi:hypothetical protein
MCVDLLFRSYKIQGFVAFDTIQAKKRNYHNRHLTDQFLPFTIEIFGCSHKQGNVFLEECANVIWSVKGPKGLPLFVLVNFFHQKISIIMQRMQARSILNRVVVIALAISQLPPL